MFVSARYTHLCINILEKSDRGSATSLSTLPFINTRMQNKIQPYRRHFHTIRAFSKLLHLRKKIMELNLHFRFLIHDEFTRKQKTGLFLGLLIWIYRNYAQRRTFEDDYFLKYFVRSDPLLLHNNTSQLLSKPLCVHHLYSVNG